MYREQRLNEKRQQGEYVEGKLRLERRRGRKRGGLARMGQREAGEEVNVVYTVGGKMREEKNGGSPTRGYLKEKGTSSEGGTFVFLDPSSRPALPQRSQVPASTSDRLEYSDGSPRGRCWGETRTQLHFSGPSRIFRETATDTETDAINQGRDQETDTQIQERHSPAPTGLTEPRLEEGRQGGRDEYPMPLGLSWLWSRRGWPP